MQHYELLCVLRGTLSEDEVAPFMEKVKEVITLQEGTIVLANDMGKRRIAYPIKHIRYGYFHLVLFDADPSRVPAIQDKLRLMPELLRSIVRVYNPAVDEGKGVPAVGIVIDEITRKDDMERPEKSDKKEKKQEPTPELSQGAASSESSEEVRKEESISMEDIDKKLDELLQSDLENV